MNINKVRTRTTKRKEEEKKRRLQLTTELSEKKKIMTFVLQLVMSAGFLKKTSFFDVNGFFSDQMS